MPNQTEASARIDLKLPLERLLLFGGARAVFLISTSQELACAFTPSQAGELLNGVAARNKVARLGKLALIGPGLGLEGASLARGLKRGSCRPDKETWRGRPSPRTAA